MQHEHNVLALTVLPLFVKEDNWMRFNKLQLRRLKHFIKCNRLSQVTYKKQQRKHRWTFRLAPSTCTSPPLSRGLQLYHVEGKGSICKTVYFKCLQKLSPCTWRIFALIRDNRLKINCQVTFASTCTVYSFLKASVPCTLYWFTLAKSLKPSYE